MLHLPAIELPKDQQQANEKKPDDSKALELYSPPSPRSGQLTRLSGSLSRAGNQQPVPNSSTNTERRIVPQSGNLQTGSVQQSINESLDGIDSGQQVQLGSNRTGNRLAIEDNPTRPTGPIIEEVTDEDEPAFERANNNLQQGRQVDENSGDGPIIEEVHDQESPNTTSSQNYRHGIHEDQEAQPSGNSKKQNGGQFTERDQGMPTESRWLKPGHGRLSPLPMGLRPNVSPESSSLNPFAPGNSDKHGQEPQGTGGPHHPDNPPDQSQAPGSGDKGLPGSGDAADRIKEKAEANTKKSVDMQLMMMDWQQKEAMNKAITEAAANVSKMWSDAMQNIASQVGK